MNSCDQGMDFTNLVALLSWWYDKTSPNKPSQKGRSQRYTLTVSLASLVCTHTTTVVVSNIQY